MSYVTNVMVSIKALEPDELKAALVGPIPGHSSQLKELTLEDWGGYRAPEVWLYACAFNGYFEDEFLTWLRGLPWRAGHHAQLFVKSQDDDGFAVSTVLAPPMRRSGRLCKELYGARDASTYAEVNRGPR